MIGYFLQARLVTSISPITQRKHEDFVKFSKNESWLLSTAIQPALHNNTFMRRWPDGGKNRVHGNDDTDFNSKAVLIAG